LVQPVELALTRDFKDTVKARAEPDPEFRVALLEETLDAFLNADPETDGAGIATHGAALNGLPRGPLAHSGDEGLT
jgi:hypothetical protein